MYISVHTVYDLSMTTTQTPTIKFEDGREFEVPGSWTKSSMDAVVALDSAGNPMGFQKWSDEEHGGMYFGLTVCCGASFKGLEDGIGCRSCYATDYDGSMGSDMPVGPLTPRAAETLPKPPAYQPKRGEELRLSNTVNTISVWDLVSLETDGNGGGVLTYDFNGKTLKLTVEITD